MKKKIVFATHNPNKLKEAREIAGNWVDILGLEEIGCQEDIPETANTLEGNALLKVKHVKEKYGYDCFADDTGLEIKELNNEPGVYSARYAGEECNTEENVKKVLRLMENVQNRNARFRTVIALIYEDKNYFFEGSVQGTITKEKKGNSGFGYDPIFIPEGGTATFAEMGDEAKNKISHRARAMNKFINFLTCHKNNHS